MRLYRDLISTSQLLYVRILSGSSNKLQASPRRNKTTFAKTSSVLFRNIYRLLLLHPAVMYLVPATVLPEKNSLPSICGVWIFAGTAHTDCILHSGLKISVSRLREECCVVELRVMIRYAVEVENQVVGGYGFVPSFEVSAQMRPS